MTHLTISCPKCKHTLHHEPLIINNTVTNTSFSIHRCLHCGTINLAVSHPDGDHLINSWYSPLLKD